MKLFRLLLLVLSCIAGSYGIGYSSGSSELSNQVAYLTQSALDLGQQSTFFVNIHGVSEADKNCAYMVGLRLSIASQTAGSAGSDFFLYDHMSAPSDRAEVRQTLVGLLKMNVELLQIEGGEVNRLASLFESPDLMARARDAAKEVQAIAQDITNTQLP